MKKCAEECKLKKTACKEKKCRYWIEYKDDFNCTLLSVQKHGKMTLREVAERLQISFVRVKQIEDKAIEKLIKTVDF